MDQKNSFRLIALSMALMITGSFMLCDLGLQIAPLTKFFIVFFVAIIVLQSMPAGFLCAMKVKSVLAERRVISTRKRLISDGVTDMKMRKILIADRDKSARRELADFFENSHYEVETTASAAYAIAKIVQKNEPIVILGDSFEEKIASVDVIALMRKCNKNLQIILVSDDSSLETLRRIRQDGIFYHALRPHNQEDNEELRSVVECAVKDFHPSMELIKI
ncbi:MAG: response regulator [Desulfuromusa sp.]|jgi:CheY-like chemotaxis protein|nr:response regulator [Desulfuromusa sp.]